MSAWLFLTTISTLVGISVGKTLPNVLFIIVDDLRPALGVYGDVNAYTPNIDKLAQNSFIFTNTYAQQALCAPSRNSLLTSRRPDTLQLYDFNSYWRHTVGNYTTLPQHLRDNGYYTHSIGKVFHAGKSSDYNDDELFSWSQKPFHPITNKFKDDPVCLDKTKNTRQSNLMCPVFVQEQPREVLPDMEVLEEALRFLRNRQLCDLEPYFLAVGFHKPHIPFKYPREFLGFHPLDKIKIPPNHYKPAMLPNVAWSHFHDVRKRDDIAALNVSFPFGELPLDVVRKITQSYAASVSYIDELVGKMLQFVDDDTIIVLTSDHGWSLGEHGEFAKYSNFDVATKVPLIIKVPGLNNDNTVVEIDGFSELVDIFPTLVELTQVSDSLPVCPEVDNDNDTILCTEGISLLPLMTGSRKPKKALKTAAFSQYPRPSTFPSLRPDSDEPKLRDITVMGYSIRTNLYRYTEWRHFNNEECQPDWLQPPVARELYDHVIDGGENMNLADRREMTAVMKHLRKRLQQGWRRHII